MTVAVTDRMEGDTAARTTAEVAAVDPAAKASLADRRRRRRRLVLRGTVVVGVLLVTWLTFHGPVGRVWYQARQRNLAADLNAKRALAAKGQALAIIQIPKINLDLVVGEGDGPAELRGGPGHRHGTALPGDVGNSVILGHHRGWGGPFSKLGQLKPQDTVVLKKRTDPQPVQFKVVSVTRVDGGDVRPLAPSTDHRVTLVTGRGGDFSGDRLIVTAVAGDQGTLQPPDRGLHASSPTGSSLFNATIGIFLLLGAAVVLTLWVFAPRHGVATIAAVAAPLAMAGLLALFLELDLALLVRLA
jgi:LPXTG-site transpeptidase (sortase) family protein